MIFYCSHSYRKDSPNVPHNPPGAALGLKPTVRQRFVGSGGVPQGAERRVGVHAVVRCRRFYRKALPLKKV